MVDGIYVFHRVEVSRSQLRVQTAKRSEVAQSPKDDTVVDVRSSRADPRRNNPQGILLYSTICILLCDEFSPQTSHNQQQVKTSETITTSTYSSLAIVRRVRR